MINGSPAGLVVHGWQAVAFWVTYAPLAAWGPLLGLLTAHYFRRRRLQHVALQHVAPMSSRHGVV